MFLFSGSASAKRVISLLDAIDGWFPTISDFYRIPLVNGVALDISPDDERPVAFGSSRHRIHVFTFVKVLAQVPFLAGSELINARTRKPERLSPVSHVRQRDG